MKEENNLVHSDADVERTDEPTEHKKPFSAEKPVSRSTVRLWWWVLYAGVVALFAVLGALVGQFVAGIEILDIEDAVTNYQQNVTTRILDGSEGDLLQELAQERRVLIGYDRIPDSFINALIAVEDKDFLAHPGVDIFGIARALIKNVQSGRVVQGGSTISQQLIKNLFLTPEQTYTRKLKEAILALQLEAKYTKQEILGFYANTIYFGHQRYGLEAASQYYFGKPAIELEEHQAALLAGMIRAPMRYTPFRHPDRAMARRNLVIERMADVGAITAEHAEELKKRGLDLVSGKKVSGVGDYFIEEVRRYLVDEYGMDTTMGGGLKVQTTMDPRMQAVAEEALKYGLLELSLRQPFRGATENALEDEIPLADYEHPDWYREPQEDSYTHALVTEVDKRSVTVRVGADTVKLSGDDIGNRNGMLSGAQRNDLTSVLKPGDVMPARIDKIRLEEQEDGTVRTRITALKMSQEPEAEAALVAIEAQTGRVLAMVGGYDFSKNQFNNAIQAQRQTGSAFKPLVLAAGLEANTLTLGDTIFDEPTVFDDPQAPELYEPENYKKAYHGIVTARETIEKSHNIAAIKMMLHIGVPQTVKIIRQMGVEKHLPPIYSLALGSIEMPLMDLVGVYSVFPNQGVYVEPYLISRIEDGDGQVLFERSVNPQTAVRQSTAFLTTQAMIGVFERGTAGNAKGIMAKYGVPLAGKTGTTDDYTDAWFVGFSPQIVCGVWVGNKEKVPLGDDESGARAALPIWSRFMDRAMAPEEWRRIRSYEIPGNVVAVTIDRRNGLLASEFTPPDDIIVEFFVRGTEPTRSTSYDDDYNLRIEQINLQEKRVTIHFEDDPRVQKKEFSRIQ